jgi:hypothetical protein
MFLKKRKLREQRRSQLRLAGLTVTMNMLQQQGGKVLGIRDLNFGYGSECWALFETSENDLDLIDDKRKVIRGAKLIDPEPTSSELTEFCKRYGVEFWCIAITR